MPTTTRKIVTNVAIPADKEKFTLQLHPDHKILALQNYNSLMGMQTWGALYSFLIEQPDTNDKVNFSFMIVATGSKFDPPKGWSYQGTIMVVVDPDADRPASEPRHIYGGRA
jgi:hypothetical protein